MPEESFSEKSKRIEERMKLLQDRGDELLRTVSNPWWYSGSACIAALLWLTFVALIILNALDYVEGSTATSARITFVAVTACIFSAMASGNKR